MLKNKPTLKFILLATGLYLLLIGVTLGLGAGQSLGKKLLTPAHSLFSSFGKQGVVEFQAYRQKSKENYDLHLALMNKKQVRLARLKARQARQKTVDVNAAAYDLNSWRYAGVPFLFVIALILASPIPWKKKLISLAVGIILFELFLLFRLRMDILFYFHSKPSLNVTDLGTISAALVEGFHRVFSQGFTMIVAILIWATVSWSEVSKVIREEWSSLSVK